VEFRQAVAETGKNWVCDIVGVFTALIKWSTTNVDLAAQFLEIRLHRRGPEAIDPNAPSAFRR
jgi:hypothetical protein